MTEIKELVPWLLEHKIRLDVVYIRNKENLADAPSFGRVRPLCLQVERGCSQTPLSAGRARLFQDLTHLCTVVTVQPSTVWSQPVTGSTRHGMCCLKFWKSFVRQEQEVSVYPYCPLQPWFQEVQQLSAFHFSLPPPRLCVR
jgi:hypothetical protein